MSALLKQYIRSLRELSDAGGASVYLTGLEYLPDGAFLLHDGDAPPPELADLEIARSLEAEAADPGDEASWREMERPVSFPSDDPACVLLRLPSIPEPGAGTRQDGEIEDRRRAGHREVLRFAWVGLRWRNAEECEAFRSQLPTEQSHTSLEGLLELGGALAAQAVHLTNVLIDPTSGLPDRREFQAMLEVELAGARDESGSVGLLLINPDEFQRINDMFGREAGDQVVREITEILRSELRSDDHVSRYGGVTFAVILVGQAAEAAVDVANRILHALSEARFLEDSLRLDFSIGLSTFRPGDERIRHHWDLVRRADQALSHAKNLGGGQAAEWKESEGVQHLESFDRLAGIFTGEVSKDYRNMILLWDTVNVIARSDDLEGMAAQTVSKLSEVLRPIYVGLWEDLDDELRVVSERWRGSGVPEEEDDDSAKPAAWRNLLRAAVGTRETQEQIGPAEEDGSGFHARYALPLVSGTRVHGALAMEWREPAAALDSSDTLFLEALGLQLAMAWQRIRLAEAERERQEGEKRQLRAELAELREAVRRAKMVYRSSQMEDLMSTAHRVADSDATILITGRSGTGKELLARTVHELSSRSDLPLVVVDCGAIPDTLIESELFGHERGAFTGATSRRQGRLVDGDGGTVLLDEVGELPLEVQSRLLRFVQEKVVTPVGGRGSQSVDVRILAATNRDLASEVAAGRFREDLYYRLNVVRLAIPSLVERPDDIMHLARHFLEVYAAQYQKSVRGFSEEAGEQLLAHSWPGNVRELQNRVMQAVLLTESGLLQAGDLRLPTAEQVATEGPEASARERAAKVVSTSPSNAAAENSSPDDGDRLRQVLEPHVLVAIEASAERRPPLGRWVLADLLVEAERSAESIAAAAVLVGLPDSTFRRRLARAQEDEGDRPSGWFEVRRLLRELVVRGPNRGQLAHLVERSLVRLLRDSTGGNKTLGAALLGVSVPTYRSRLHDLGGD